MKKISQFLYQPLIDLNYWKMLSSLYDQDTDINIDCIISDNCSNDDTEDLVKA